VAGLRILLGDLGEKQVRGEGREEGGIGEAGGFLYPGLYV
jgi:hypothetical protein